MIENNIIKTILLSIIVTVYNTPEEFLKDCIDSILAQDVNKEIIIVDDGSEMSIALLCDDYQQRYSDVRVIHQENMGASAARNCGIKAMKGKYFTIVDSDDWIAKGTLQLALFEAEEHQSDIVLWNTNVVIDKEVHQNFFLPQSICSCELSAQQISDLMIQMICPGFEGMYKPEYAQAGGTLCKLYRSDFIRKIGVLYNEKLRIYEDPIFNFEVFSKTNRIYYEKKQLYNYRIVQKSVSRGFKSDLNLRFLRSFEVFNTLLTDGGFDWCFSFALDAKIQQVFSDLVGVFFLSPEFNGGYTERKKEFDTFYNHKLVRMAENNLYLDNLSANESFRRKIIKNGNFLMLYLLYGRACMKNYQKIKKYLGLS